MVTKLAIDFIVTANSASPPAYGGGDGSLMLPRKASVLSVTLRLYSWVLPQHCNISNKRPGSRSTSCVPRRSLNFADLEE